MFADVIHVTLFSYMSLSVTHILVFSVPGRVILVFLKALNCYFWASVSVKKQLHSIADVNPLACLTKVWADGDANNFVPSTDGMMICLVWPNKLWLATPNAEGEVGLLS